MRMLYLVGYRNAFRGHSLVLNFLLQPGDPRELGTITQSATLRSALGPDTIWCARIRKSGGLVTHVQDTAVPARDTAGIGLAPALPSSAKSPGVTARFRHPGNAGPEGILAIGRTLGWVGRPHWRRASQNGISVTSRICRSALEQFTESQTFQLLLPRFQKPAGRGNMSF
jgi:hypothetical protein